MCPEGPQLLSVLAARFEKDALGALYAQEALSMPADEHIQIRFQRFTLSLAQEQGGLGWRSKPVQYQRNEDDVILILFVLSP